MKKIFTWLSDPFFWDLIEAQHSPDSESMGMLFNKYSAL